MNLTATAHALAGDFAKRHPVHCAFDATMGNGHDSLALSRLLSPDGRLYAFDVQQAALDSTRRLLEAGGVCLQNVRLIKSSHENFDSEIPPEDLSRLSCAFFNLGWLPGSDKRVTTTAASTLRTLEKLAAHFHVRGAPAFLSVLSYRGHAEGALEHAEVSAFFGSLCAELERFEGSPSEASPVLFVARFK